MLQVGETVDSFGGVEPVRLRLLDVSLETLDTFTGQVADPQEIMEICRFASRRPRIANGDGNRWCCVRVEFEFPQADTDSLAGDLGDHDAPPGAMALALSGLGSWPP